MLTTLLIGFVGGCAGGISTKIAEDVYGSMKTAIAKQPNVKKVQENIVNGTANISNRVAGWFLPKEEKC